MGNKIIIFDMDGVIIDSIGLMLKLNQNRFPGSSRKDLELLFTGNILEQVDNLKETYNVGDVSEEEQQKLAKAYTEEKTQTVELYPGIQELLGDLRCKYQLSVNTSASDANTFRLLDRLEIKDCFDHIITRDFAKGKVDKFHELARLYACKVTDFVFITDSLGDVKEAAELDIPTIAVTWGVHGQEYFDMAEYKNLKAIVGSVDGLQKELTSFVGQNKK